MEARQAVKTGNSHCPGSLLRFARLHQGRAVRRFILGILISDSKQELHSQNYDLRGGYARAWIFAANPLFLDYGNTARLPLV